jgi:hypothetical protein
MLERKAAPLHALVRTPEVRPESAVEYQHREQQDWMSGFASKFFALVSQPLSSCGVLRTPRRNVLMYSTVSGDIFSMKSFSLRQAKRAATFSSMVQTAAFESAPVTSTFVKSAIA